MEDSDTSKKKEVAKSVPFHKLFLFADRTDYALMFVGTITAIGSGISFPFITLILGELIDTFGGTVDSTEVVHAVSKVKFKPLVKFILTIAYLLDLTCLTTSFIFIIRAADEFTLN